MKNHSIGLGILALLISLNLLFLGTTAVKTTSSEAFLPKSDTVYTISKLASNAVDGGILQRQIDTSASTDSIRKFPATVCLLFFAFTSVQITDDKHRTGEFASISAFKELFLAFHNLRI